jgi:hypothetical protein
MRRRVVLSVALCTLFPSWIIGQSLSGRQQTLRSIRQTYLNQAVVVTGTPQVLAGKNGLLEWESAKEQNGRYVDPDMLDKLPDSYRGKTAKVIAVQMNRLHHSESGMTNALGEAVSEDDTPNPYFDMVVQFDDGKIGMVTTYISMLDTSVALASEHASRIDEMAKNLPLVIGKPLYAVTYSQLYQPDTTLAEMTGQREILKRLSVLAVPLLEPLFITAAKYVENIHGIVMKVRLPDGSEALTFTPSVYLDHAQKDASFLARISGTLLPELPRDLTPKEVNAIKHHVVFKGMSKNAVYDALGFSEKENDWGAGGRQLIFLHGSVLVYLSQDDTVADWQSLDNH